MTPEAKAKELIERFRPHTKIGQEGNVIMLSKHAKACALICVDEMINNASFIWGGRNDETSLSARDTFRKYWQSVKTAI